MLQSYSGAKLMPFYEMEYSFFVYFWYFFAKYVL